MISVVQARLDRNGRQPRRVLLCRDSLPWLRRNVGRCGAVVTSLPDVEEVQMDPQDYRPWFIGAAADCIRAASGGAPVIFYQTDRRVNGATISKAGLLFTAASEVYGAGIVWHKIVLRREAGNTDLFRPTFSHLVCIGDRAVRPGKATPDVIRAGPAFYPNGTGIHAAIAACSFAASRAAFLTDPFCGHGTIVAAANHVGLPAVGIDIDAECITASRTADAAALLREE